jgi:hypothetical protein
MAEFTKSVPGARSFDDANSCPRCSGPLDAIAGQPVCSTCGPLDEIMAPADDRSVAERFPQAVAPKRAKGAMPPLPPGMTMVQATPEVRKRLIADHENQLAAQKIASVRAEAESVKTVKAETPKAETVGAGSDF